MRRQMIFLGQIKLVSGKDVVIAYLLMVTVNPTNHHVIFWHVCSPSNISAYGLTL